MRTYKYKIVVLFMLMTGVIYAQKHDKKVSEKFKVDNDVTVVINANNTDVDIETWNKNEVAIEGVIEVEGVSKEEAEKIFKSWKFEALGNGSKVKITSHSGNMHFDFAHDFNFDFDFDFDMPEMEFELPEFEFELQDLFQNIELPEMNFEFPEINIEIPEFDNIEFDYEAYKNDTTYLKKYKKQIQENVEKFKNSDWKIKMDSVRNTAEYKAQMEQFKKEMEKMNVEMKKMQESKEYKAQMKEAKKAAEQYRKQVLENEDVIKAQVEAAKVASAQAQEMIKKMKEEGYFEKITKHGENVYFKGDDKDSSIKIRKYIKVKVPKNAKFDLNVRHGKLNVPSSSTKMSATISYGDFVAGIIDGEKNELKISNSPVEITTVNAANITLKNVPNATFGTFSNANLFANSADVLIENVGNNVALSQKFGELEIKSLSPNFVALNLILEHAKAKLDFTTNEFVYKINGKNSTFDLFEQLSELKNNTVDGVRMMEGFLNNRNSNNTLTLTGVYSTIAMN